jgi:Carboxypeptidase regulatory-like domain/TonB dependent receptor-like, beta-barrel/TonB-dependent Receptor Plug Domain
MTRRQFIQTRPPRAIFYLLLAVFLLVAHHSSLVTVSGQSATATLSGTVEDQSGAMVAGASVTALNLGTRLQREATTNARGFFIIPLLPPSTYTVTVRRDGFAPLEIKDVALNVNDQRSLQIQLKIGNVGDTVNVVADSGIQESAAVGTVIDRQFVENLPLNGRSFQSLFELTPGVVLTKTAEGGEQGQFSVNGQRGNANYFTVDGVSANIGISPGVVPGQAGGGSLPGLSAFGGTSNLVSVDALQEFKIQTSTYAPEFGRTPGGQISIVTRSGTNGFHGTLFEFFRNDALDANDWFANANRLPKPALRQNDFGGVLGGPLYLPRFGEGGPTFRSGKDRTFFFFSYEGLRLRQPQVGISEVPSLVSRRNVPAQVQPFLNAFPLPNGPDTRNGLALFSASYSNPTELNATSIRVDHLVGSKLTLFGRYNDAPSNTGQRGGNLSLNTVNLTRVKTQTLTAGATLALSPAISNDLRFNYSRSRAGISILLDDFGGAIPLPEPIAFPAPHASPIDSQFAFRLIGATQAFYQAGRASDNLQHQFNLVNSLSVTKESHQLKVGVDYRRLLPIAGPRRYTQLLSVAGIQGAQTGRASVFIESNQRVGFVLNNLSLYGQDTWKATRRLTLTYGLRWEVNPPPSESSGNDPFGVTGVDDLSTITLAPRGAPLYQTTYDNFAPRVGVAYQLSQKQGRETVLRGGFGLFYDLGSATVTNVAAAGSFPYGTRKSLFNVSIPLDSISAAPSPFSLNPPIGFFFATDPDLQLPRTYQFNAAIEQSFGANQTITASYVGAIGRRLLRTEQLFFPNNNFVFLELTTNSATSDYHAMQLHYQRRLSRGLQALASYTWSHSIDIASDDSFPNTPGLSIDPQNNRGASDFDVRHSFTAAVTYNIPVPDAGAVGNAILRNWSLDGIYRTRSATPVNIITGDSTLLDGSFSPRPNLITGAPLYVGDPNVPGGRRINRAAFSTPPQNQQGTLGRNALRGFPLSQLDLALRRQFGLTERVKLQLRAEAFNIFNHPNFGDPEPNLSNSLFGQSRVMLGRSLGGGGGARGGFSPLYQIGGPRSIQLAVKLLF